MNKELFLEIVASMDSEVCLEDFSYKHNGEKYGFDISDDGWEDDGKYQYKYEQGQLVEFDEKYHIIQKFNFGITRTVSRTGSYYNDYYYDYSSIEAHEITEIIVPEVIIPEHTEEKWIKID